MTTRQELWAQHFALSADAKAAALAAGYSPVRADNRASENRYNPAVLARVRELVQLRQCAGAPVATNLIEAIALGDFSDPRKAAVQLRAAITMANVAGVGPVVRTASTAVVEHRTTALPTEDQIAAAAARLRRELGF